MSTQHTTKAGIPYSQLDDENWHLPLANAAALLDGLNAVGGLAVRPAAPGTAAPLPSTSLNVNVGAGVFLNASLTLVSYAGTTGYSLSNNTTTRIWLTDAGSLASGASYPAATQIVRLATVVTSGGFVTAITDDRVPFLSFGGSTSGFVAKAGDTLGDGADFALGTTTGTKIGTATTQKLGFFNKTPVVQPANTSDLRQLLIDLGLLASGGASPLNLNGGTLVGGVRLPTQTITASTTLTSADGLVEVNAAANVTVTLPDAAANSGRELVIKRIDSTGNTVSVARAGADMIDGATSYSGLSAQWKYVRLIANSTRWNIVGSN
jgi:hypothetical protein